MPIRVPSEEVLPLVRMLEAMGMPADSKSATLRMAVNDVVTVDVQFMPKNLEGMGDAIALVKETYVLIRKDSIENQIHTKASKFIKLRAEKMELKKKRNKLMRSCLNVETNENNRACFFSSDGYGESPRCEKCEEADYCHEKYLEANGKATGALNALRNAVQKNPCKEDKTK